jgi:hypothetical protein
MVLACVSIDLHACQSTLEPDARDGSRLFPADTTIFLQVKDIGAIAQRAWDHPLREKIESLQQVRKALASPQFLQARVGLAMLEGKLETDWMTGLKSLASEGVFIGANPDSQVVGVAIHASDEQLLKNSITAVLQFIKSQAAKDAVPFKVSKYANGKVAKFGKDGTIGRFGPWLLISNKHDYLLKMADRITKSENQETLADSDSFRTARKLVANNADAWIYTDLRPIRASGEAQQLFRGMTEEPGIELLFGGILEALKDAPWVAADIALQAERISLNARLPYDVEQIPAEREFFFGTKGQGRAPAKLDLPNTTMQATIYRNLGNWWLNKEDLFPENVVAQLAQGDSQLSTIFGGVDFGSDILGSLQPGMRLIVKEQQYSEGVDPDTKLPAFALVTRLKNPEQARRFRISFQSLVGLLNLSEDGMDRPQIEVMSTREDGIQMTSGTYAPEGGFEGNLLIFNFSPTLAFQDDFMIISSTEQLAREVALKTKELSKQTGDKWDESDSNATIAISFPQLAKILRLNRPAIVASQMLEQGMKRAAAEDQVDLILELMDFGEAADLDFRVERNTLRLQVALKLKGK